MIESIGRARVSGSRGRGKPREVKKRPKSRFPIRKRGKPAPAVKLNLEIVIVSGNQAPAN